MVAVPQSCCQGMAGTIDMPVIFSLQSPTPDFFN